MRPGAFQTCSRDYPQKIIAHVITSTTYLQESIVNLQLSCLSRVLKGLPTLILHHKTATEYVSPRQQLKPLNTLRKRSACCQ